MSLSNRARAAVGWIRGTVMVVGLSSATYADQIAEHVAKHEHAEKIRVVGISLAAASVVLRAGQQNQTPEQIRQIVASGPPPPPSPPPPPAGG